MFSIHFYIVKKLWNTVGFLRVMLFWNIYIYMCVCVCVCVSSWLSLSNNVEFRWCQITVMSELYFDMKTLFWDYCMNFPCFQVFYLKYTQSDLNRRISNAKMWKAIPFLTKYTQATNQSENVNICLNMHCTRLKSDIYHILLVLHLVCIVCQLVSQTMHTILTESDLFMFVCVTTATTTTSTRPQLYIWIRSSEWQSPPETFSWKVSTKMRPHTVDMTSCVVLKPILESELALCVSSRELCEHVHKCCHTVILAYIYECVCICACTCQTSNTVNIHIQYGLIIERSFRFKATLKLPISITSTDLSHP